MKIDMDNIMEHNLNRFEDLTEDFIDENDDFDELEFIIANGMGMII